MKRCVWLILVLIIFFSLFTPVFADEDILYCRMCGRQIPADSKVCCYCGVPVVLVGEDRAGASASASPKSDAPEQKKTAGTRLDYSGVFDKVRITKNPTSESVPYGGACTFIAHAANAISVTWYITSGDGSISATVYEAADSIPGLYVSGGNTDTLKLSGIPSWLNGSEVRACFTGFGGPIYSEPARIWTYQPAASQEAGETFWWWKFLPFLRFSPGKRAWPSVSAQEFN